MTMDLSKVSNRRAMLLTPAYGMLASMVGASYRSYTDPFWMFAYVLFSVLVVVSATVLVCHDSINDRDRFVSGPPPSPGEFLDSEDD